MLLDPFSPIRDIITVVEYIATDQEAEGRAKGIETAANIYKPVLKKLEDRQKKIILATDQEQKHFENQAKTLRAQCAEYEQKTLELAAKIKNNSGEKSSSINNFFVTVERFGMYSAHSVDVIGGRIYDSWSLSNYLEKKMNEKREKFYKIEFEKKSLEWQGKIKNLRAQIVESINNLKNLKSYNKNQLEYISKIVDDALKEYCESIAKYNALVEMEG